MRWSRGSTGGEGGRRRHLQRTGSYVNSNEIYKYLESRVGQDSAIHVGTGCSLAWQGRQGSDAASALAPGSEVEQDSGSGQVPALHKGLGTAPAQDRASHSVRDRYNTSRDAPRDAPEEQRGKARGDRAGAVPEQEQHRGCSCPGRALGANRPWEPRHCRTDAAASQDVLGASSHVAPNQKQLEGSFHSQLIWRTRECHRRSW